ncbi:MAG: DUF1385 domain-containing protein [Lachnospiraceae bacterium]|nr:DUF1385 domain-containing protein [Lachnospiraceae bacterium]
MKSSGIGGQAVLEGIMMRNGGKYAVAVRKPDKEIIIDVKEHVGLTEKYKFLNVPFIRGVFKFAESLSIGIKTLTYSAEFFDDEEEENIKENASDEKSEKKEINPKLESFLMGLTVCFSVLFSVGLFIVLPFLIGEFFRKIVGIESNTVIAIFEGFARISIFILYLVLISKMKDIQRTFMYHGAEHKCINCIEHGMELNLENVKKSSRLHKRCGTSFLLFVVVISIISFIIVSAIIPEASTGWLKLVVRLALIPIIAGISFEILRLAGNSDGKIIGLLSKPGMWLQQLTTIEPEDDMIEVGIASVEAIFDWKKYLVDNFDENSVDNSKTDGAMANDIPAGE